MQKRFELVIFDLDGTLIDNRYAIRQNYNHARAVHGYAPVTDSDIDAMIGIPLQEMFERELPESEHHLAASMVNAYRARYREMPHDGVVIFDDVIQTLEYLKDNSFKTSLATTKLSYIAEMLLQKIGLAQYFDLIAGSTETIMEKPHPDIIFDILGKLSVNRERAVLVEDTPTGIMTGKNAGVYTIAVTTSVPWATTMEALRQAGPDQIIASLSELQNHLYL